MGNTAAGESLPVPTESVNAMRENTPFSYKETEMILRRYGSMDGSANGKEGISVKDCREMPEFTGNVFAPDVIGYYADADTGRIHPRQFAQICKLFSRKTHAQIKKECLFDMFDVDSQNVFTHDVMFRIYKLLFSNGISDDHILALTYSALRHPHLLKEGEISRKEFLKMIPDNEILERLTIDFVNPWG